MSPAFNKPVSTIKKTALLAAAFFVCLSFLLTFFSCEDKSAEKNGEGKVKDQPQKPQLASADVEGSAARDYVPDPVGKRLMETGNYEKAAEYYRDLVNEKPDDMMPCIGLGRALCVMGRTGEALSVYTDCARDHPEASPVYVARGLCKQISKGNFVPPPEEDFKKAISIDPSNSSAHNQLGLIYQSRFDLESAETEFRTAIAYEPGFFVAYNNLATVLIEQGRYDEAITLLQKAVSLKPDLRGIYIYTNQGLAYLHSGRTRRAEAAFLMEIVINPQHLPAHIYLGNLYALSGRYGDAIQEYQRVILSDPQNREALINQGAVYLLAGKNHLAVNRLEKAVRLYPRSALAHYHLARAYRKTGQKSRAREQMHRAKELGYKEQ